MRSLALEYAQDRRAAGRAAELSQDPLRNCLEQSMLGIPIAELEDPVANSYLSVCEVFADDVIPLRFFRYQ